MNRTKTSHLNWRMFCLNYPAWSPSPEWPAVSCRSSGRCCSTARPCWAARTCCRSSPSTCSPSTTTTAGVGGLFDQSAADVFQKLRTNLLFRMVIVSSSPLCSSGEEGEARSALHEQSIALGLGMFALLVQRCTELLRDTPPGIHECMTVKVVFCHLSEKGKIKNVLFTNPLSLVPMDDAEEGQRGEEMEGMVHVSTSSLDLRELLPSIKVWSDWMLGHPDQWNPPPHSLE